MGLGSNHTFVDCEGLILPSGHVMVHGKDSAGDFWTCCYDERTKSWKSDAIRLYHDQSQDDEVNLATVAKAFHRAESHAAA